MVRSSNPMGNNGVDKPKSKIFLISRKPSYVVLELAALFEQRVAPLISGLEPDRKHCQLMEISLL